MKKIIIKGNLGEYGEKAILFLKTCIFVSVRIFYNLFSYADCRVHLFKKIVHETLTKILLYSFIYQ